MTYLVFLLLFSFQLLAQEPETPLATEVKAEVAPAPEENVNGLFLYSTINTLNFTWKDLSVEGEESFLNPLNQNWIEWFKQNQQDFKTIEACIKSCVLDLNSWLEGATLEKRTGIWVKTDLNIRRLEDERFEISGGVVFLDIASRKSLGAKTIELQKITLPLLDLKQRNSALASHLYRMTLSSYTSLIPSMSSEKDSRSLKLTIQGFKSLNDIQALENLIREKNSSLDFKSTLVGFARQEAQLKVTFKGEEKLFTDLLSGLKELKSSRRFTLVHEFKENSHVLKMIAE